MAQEASSYPIRLAAGGHRGQLIVIGACLIVGALLFLLPYAETRFILLFPLVYGAAAFAYRFLNKSAVVIFDDRVEFHDWSDDDAVVQFRDVTSIEYRVRNRGANDYYITIKNGSVDERIQLPRVYNDVFSPLKRALITWYSKFGPASVVQDMADGSDGSHWNAPRWKLT